MPCRGAAPETCPEQQYWDALVCRCMPCALACGRAAVPRCAALCEASACARRAGSYYDELLRRCVSCSAVCGQHPTQCAPACEGESAPRPAPSARGPPAPPGSRVSPCPAATTAAAAPAGGAPGPPCAEQEPWLVLYLLLGLCLLALLCSLALGWSHLRRRADGASCPAGAGSCHRRDDPVKDRLVEAAGGAEGCAGRGAPEPVETCGFCFPERGPAAPRGPDDGRFTIICSPAQEKAALA
ncbi:tumor necrosis factor receptor superfamily member 13B [Eudromia elegans]